MRAFEIFNCLTRYEINNMRDVSALEKMGTIVRLPHLQFAAQFALGPAEVCTVFFKARCNAKRI